MNSYKNILTMNPTVSLVFIFLSFFAATQALRMHSQSAQTFKINHVNQQQTALTLLDEDVEITFNGDHVSFHGCNTYNGDIDVDSNTGVYVLGMMVSTRMFCPHTHDEDVHQALLEGNRIIIQADLLRIFNSNNELLLTGTRVAGEEGQKGEEEQKVEEGQKEVEESSESSSEDSDEISASINAKGSFQMDPVSVQAITKAILQLVVTTNGDQGQASSQQTVSVDPVVFSQP